MAGFHIKSLQSILPIHRNMVSFSSSLQLLLVVCLALGVVLQVDATRFSYNSDSIEEYANGDKKTATSEDVLENILKMVQTNPKMNAAYAFSFINTSEARYLKKTTVKKINTLAKQDDYLKQFLLSDEQIQVQNARIILNQLVPYLDVHKLKVVGPDPVLINNILKLLKSDYYHENFITKSSQSDLPTILVEDAF